MAGLRKRILTAIHLIPTLARVEKRYLRVLEVSVRPGRIANSLASVAMPPAALLFALYVHSGWRHWVQTCVGYLH